MHYGKLVIRRVPKSSPCANHRAHGEESLCRGPNTKHTVKIKHTVKGDFAVCPKLSTRQTECFAVCNRPAHGEEGARHPCKQKTAGCKWPVDAVHLCRLPIRRVPNAHTRQRERHMARHSRPVDAGIFCRVPPLGTRRIDLFAVCHMDVCRVPLSWHTAK